MDTLLQDVRFAIRMLRRSPGFTIAAISTLALGISATTAIFSTANAALLKPLPYPRSEDLRTVRTARTNGDVTSGLMAAVELSALKEPQLPVERAALVSPGDATLLLDGNRPRPILVAGVTEEFFGVFGLPNTLGSGFRREHFRPGSGGGAVISYGLWRDLLGSDPNIVGKTLRFFEQDVPVLGVAARELDVPRGAAAWLPMALDSQSLAHSYEGYLRLRPGTDPELLRNSLDAMAQRLAKSYPGAESNRTFIVQPLVTTMVGELRPILIIVLSATGLLLVLACVNVTNLLLVRTAGRRREIAVRLALGAKPNRVVRQLITESIVLSTFGALIGIVLAYAGVRALLLYGAAQLPRLQTVPFDVSVLLFAVTTVVVSAVLVSAAPALEIVRARSHALIGERGQSVRGSRSGHRLLRAMTVAEIAVAVLLVAGAGWLVRSFNNLQGGDPGFSSAGRLVVDVSLPFQRYRDPAQRAAWTQALLQELRGINGVVAVGASSAIPLQPDDDSTPLYQVQGSSDRPGGARRRMVSPEFFATMGIPLRRGRVFTDNDRHNTERVAIVSESFARRYLTGRDPLTARISYGFPTIRPGTQSAVVGIVGDVKYASLWTEPEPTFYILQAQADNFIPESFRFSVAIATSVTNPERLAPQIRAAVNTKDPLLGLTITSVPEIVASALNRQKLGMTLMLLFGLIALTLAAVGIYGVIAYASTQRRSEVATRMALGATPADIFALMSRQGRIVAVVGSLIGLSTAMIVGRLATNWLYEVKATDPIVLAVSLGLVLSVTVVAVMIPARRMTRVNPGDALRAE